MVQMIRMSNGWKLALVVVFIVGLKLASMHREHLKSVFSEPTQSQNLSEQQFLETDLDPSENFDVDLTATVEGDITTEMEEIINLMRKQIKNETEEYKLPSGRSIRELLPEEGGTPMRSLVITTWRSGSTFIGGVLNSHPATYHYSEPLTEFKTVQVRGEPLASAAVHVLYNLLTCNYQVLGRYLERSKEYTWLFTHNTRLWQHCKEHKDICFQPQFLSPVCRLFPFQSTKVVHIRLRLVEELLQDPKLNVRVVLLVRDPRAVMHSRSSLKWCMKHEDCGEPVRVCADFIDDYAAALRFSKLFPDRFKVVRYEDMSLRPQEVMPEVFAFFGLQYHDEVRQFVHIHTTRQDNNRYSTYRNSSQSALSWRAVAEHGDVRALQSVCRVALDAWGYLPAHNADHQRTFQPFVEPFVFP